jgi:CubicO group peptidase (beta-lactamase class C family)
LNKSWIYTTILLLFYLIAASAEIDSIYFPDKNVIDSFLRKTVNTYNIPGLAVAIVNDKEIIFISGYGESSPGIDISSDTPFLLGSTSKTFTALGIMRLVEEGKVELDAPVKKYLPEFKLATPEYDSVITIRHLLNHTSGLSDKGMPKTSFLAHGGSLENYQSFFYLNPELNLGFVFLINQGGILPMIGGFSTLRNGLIRIIDKGQPQKGPGSWPVIIISGIFLLITGIEVYITFRLQKLVNDLLYVT